jgi:hypothetical protein
MSAMHIDELRAEIRAIFEPEPDEDGNTGYRDLPHPRLISEHGLDLAYLETFNWEGSTIHPSTRICPTDATAVHVLTRNSDVPLRLFNAALRLFGDSIVAYFEAKERSGPLRFYPPVILTFWSGFETFVRYSSELLLATTTSVPPTIANVLRELEPVVNRQGITGTRVRYQPVLERYFLLLKYGYGYDLDRGARFWQRLVAAQTLRDYYTHLDVTDPRSLSATDVLRFTESVLLGIITPSAHLKRTQLLHVYDLYWAWNSLRILVGEFVEQPFFKDWPIGEERYMFYSPFDGVDSERFPNSEQDRDRYLRNRPT